MLPGRHGSGPADPYGARFPCVPRWSVLVSGVHCAVCRPMVLCAGLEHWSVLTPGPRPLAELGSAADALLRQLGAAYPVLLWLRGAVSVPK